MKDEIKEILDKLKSLDYDEYNLEFSVDYIERKEEKLLLDCITNLQQKYDKALTDLVQESHTRMELENKITNLQEVNTKIRKILIEHIEDARYELNVILHSDNDLNYKNECSREFEILNKNIRMILDKIDIILNGGDE